VEERVVGTAGDTAVSAARTRSAPIAYFERATDARREWTEPQESTMNTSHEGSPAMGTPQAAPPPAGTVPPPYSPPVPAWDPRLAARRRNPAVAGLLSFLMPGLGQVYLGYYQRGFVHAGVFALLVATLASGAARGMEPLIGISLGFFYLYNVIDAVRRASLLNQALAGYGAAPLPEDFKMPEGRSSLLAGVVVTALGLILFANSRFDFNLDWLADYWPLFVILLGLNMVYRAWKSRPQQ